MPPYRDVAAFNDRAAGYDLGWRGRLHHEIADRTATLAVATVAAPSRVLDLGCGTGYLLRSLANRYRDAQQLVGIDAAPEMVRTANATAGDDRLTFTVGVAEHIGYPDETFDLIVSTTSFDHWSDQPAGLGECAGCFAPAAGWCLSTSSRGGCGRHCSPAAAAKPAPGAAPLVCCYVSGSAPRTGTGYMR